MTKYRCPKCHESDGLWQEIEVEGWQAVNDELDPTGERDVDWTTIQTWPQGGCRCGWQGPFSQLSRQDIGIDGKPLPHIHDGQLEIEAA